MLRGLTIELFSVAGIGLGLFFASSYNYIVAELLIDSIKLDFLRWVVAFLVIYSVTIISVLAIGVVAGRYVPEEYRLNKLSRILAGLVGAIKAITIMMILAYPAVVSTRIATNLTQSSFSAGYIIQGSNILFEYMVPQFTKDIRDGVLKIEELYSIYAKFKDFNLDGLKEKAKQEIERTKEKAEAEINRAKKKVNKEIDRTKDKVDKVKDKLKKSEQKIDTFDDGFKDDLEKFNKDLEKEKRSLSKDLTSEIESKPTDDNLDIGVAEGDSEKLDNRSGAPALYQKGMDTLKKLRVKQ